MNKEEAIEKAVEYVETHPGTSFPELCRLWFGSLDGGKGDLVLEYADLNIVIWGCINEEFLTLLDALLKSGKVVGKPCQLLIYMVDGMCLSLPIAKRVPRSGKYKKPHWLPMTLYTPSEYKKEYKNDPIPFSK